MKLFYSPGTCALAPMILAEWLQLPMKIEQVNNRDPSPEYLAINPLGAVPALQLDDGSIKTQVDAILQYFCGLAPNSGLDGGPDLLDHFEVHRWVAFLTGDYHPPFGGWFNPRRFTVDHSDPALANVKLGLEKRIIQVSRVLDEHVGENNHIVLQRKTLLDAYAYSMLRWLKKLHGGLEQFPNLFRFMAVTGEDAGVKRALDREAS